VNKILIIVPAYNEAENIRGVIHKLHSENEYWDILVINDASADNTSAIARETGHAEVLDLPFNLGIGGCVQTGFRYARNKKYDFALQFDGDGQHSAEEIHKLLAIVMNKEADVAIGSRFSQKHSGYKSSSYRRIGIRIFEWFSFLLIHQRITDHTSGFRAYNLKAVQFLADHYPSDYPEPEVVILLGKNGFKIKETFTQMHERQGGVSSIPFTKGPYYMIKVMLAMFMAAIRSKINIDERRN
jgi:glycosyltransferase involved in cell wall biosynthesis